MVKELVHDPIFLSVKSEKAGREDLQAAADLLDTLKAHRESCVGMAANMIGVSKCIIVFEYNGDYMTMFNPRIIKKSGPYPAQEACLSLLGGPRKTRRWKKIKVEYENADFQTRVRSFEGFTAQIIQHETDHCGGILI